MTYIRSFIIRYVISGVTVRNANIVSNFRDMYLVSYVLYDPLLDILIGISNNYLNFKIDKVLN